MAYEIKQNMMEDGICTNELEQWASVYTAATIISNRETPFHRDLGSRVEWYDLLTSFGPYTRAPLFMDPIGIRVNNPPGTVCAFSGMALSHSVRRILTSRISMALYLRENMREGADVDPAFWMNQMQFEAFMGGDRGDVQKMGRSVSRETMEELVKSFAKVDV